MDFLAFLLGYNLLGYPNEKVEKQIRRFIIPSEMIFFMGCFL